MFDADTGGAYQSNLSNSDRSSDIESDWVWLTNARISNGIQITRDLRLTAGGDFRSHLWSEYDDFDEGGLGLPVGLRYRFGLGRTAPWVLLENRIGYDWFHDGARSGWSEKVGLRGGMGISERLALEIGYAFENVATPDTFFDEQSHRIDVRLFYDLTSSLRVSLGYIYREGDVISYAVPPRPDIVPLVEAEREDVDTFGVDPLYNAYKLLGRTHALSVSASYAVTKNFSFEVDYEYAVTSHDPLQYENHFVEAKVAFSY
jgi:hypothetical protein